MIFSYIKLDNNIDSEKAKSLKRQKDKQLLIKNALNFHCWYDIPTILLKTSIFEFEIIHLRGFPLHPILKNW